VAGRKTALHPGERQEDITLAVVDFPHIRFNDIIDTDQGTSIRTSRPTINLKATPYSTGGSAVERHTFSSPSM
jgi:hypothetical protein